MILPPHLRESDIGESDDSMNSNTSSVLDLSEANMPKEIRELDPEDPMRDMMVDEWKRKMLKKHKKRHGKKSKKSRH